MNNDSFFLLVLLVAILCFIYYLSKQANGTVSQQQFNQLSENLERLQLQFKTSPSEVSDRAVDPLIELEATSLNERISKLESLSSNPTTSIELQTPSLHERISELEAKFETLSTNLDKAIKNSPTKNSVRNLDKEAKELKQLHQELNATFNHLKAFGLIELPNIWFAESPVEKCFLKGSLRRHWIPNITFYRIEQSESNPKIGILTLLPDKQTQAIVLAGAGLSDGVCITTGVPKSDKHLPKIHAGTVTLDEHHHWKVTKNIEIEYFK